MKLTRDEPLSNVAFNFNVRRYIEVQEVKEAAATTTTTRHTFEAGEGRCRFTVSKPEWKARLLSEYSLETTM